MGAGLQPSGPVGVFPHRLRDVPDRPLRRTDHRCHRWGEEDPLLRPTLERRQQLGHGLMLLLLSRRAAADAGACDGAASCADQVAAAFSDARATSYPITRVRSKDSLNLLQVFMINSESFACGPAGVVEIVKGDAVGV